MSITRQTQLFESIDMRNGAIRGIEYAHAAVHDDAFVIASDHQDTVDIATPLVYLITAPDDYELHLIVQAISSAGALLQTYKDPTFSASGTPVTHLRPNLWSTVSRVTTYHTPTTSADGTLIYEVRNPGNESSTANSRIGGTSRNGEEIILPGGRSLLLRVTVEANGTDVSFVNEYYEVPSGVTNTEA